MWEVKWIIILLHVATIENCVQFHILMGHVKFSKFVQKFQLNTYGSTVFF